RELCYVLAQTPEKWALCTHQRLGAAIDGPIEGRGEAVRAAHFDRLQLDAELSCCGVHVSHDQVLESARCSKHGDASRLWQELLQELHSLHHELGCEMRYAGHVAAGVSEALDDSGFDWIEARRQDDRYRGGRLLHDRRRRRRCRNDDVH